MIIEIFGILGIMILGFVIGAIKKKIELNRELKISQAQEKHFVIQRNVRMDAEKIECTTFNEGQFSNKIDEWIKLFFNAIERMIYKVARLPNTAKKYPGINEQKDVEEYIELLNSKHFKKISRMFEEHY